MWTVQRDGENTIDSLFENYYNKTQHHEMYLFMQSVTVLIARWLISNFGSGHSMSYFDAPPGQRVLREFTIRRDQRGRWLVAEMPGPVSVRAFHSHNAAEQYALREAEGDYNRIHFLPSQV
jgi:hypothetical protein